MVGFVWIDFESIVFALPILAEMTYTWHGQWTEFTCRKCDVRLAKNVIFDLIMHIDNDKLFLHNFFSMNYILCQLSTAR